MAYDTHLAERIDRILFIGRQLVMSSEITSLNTQY